MKPIWLGLVLLLLGLPSCNPVHKDFAQAAANPDFIHRSMKKLTDVIVYDIFSPPVASRIYTYSSIAAYEALVNDNTAYRSLAGQLNGLDSLPKPVAGQTYCFPLASIQAFLKTGKKFIFSEDQIEAFEKEIMAEFKKTGIPNDVFERSVDYGNTVSAHILAWADKDNYKQSRTFPKYSITEDISKWKPTPPAYMDGIEPHWNTIRPFVMDSAQQFKPLPPTPFDTLPSSRFYQEAMQVYTALQEDTENRTAIASFWDCNPYVSHQKGHVTFATKKITPGGHWIGISKIAALQSNANIMQTTETYVKVALALVDGFISCWDEKYRSSLVRPETFINAYINETWSPLLQTPPFPEYTSGHSVISNAAAVVLTDLFGDNFAYTDNVEVEYGLSPRTYNSFLEASREASISRLYGGIHYTPAITNGAEQGAKVGHLVVNNVITRSK
jgi:hypothetical protein